MKNDAVETGKLVLVRGRQRCGFVWRGEGGFSIRVPAGLHCVMNAVVTRLQLISKTLVRNVKILDNMFTSPAMSGRAACLAVAV